MTTTPPIRRRMACPVLGCLLLLLLAPAEIAASPRPSSSPFLAQADHPEVESELQYFQGPGRASMDRWLNRGTAFLPMIRRQIATTRLPEDLCWLPLIESGFSNTAVSQKGAVGMWQLMPATARMYGLRVDGLVDERRNPVKATRAALDHLADLMGRFGSPYLALAAYNAGSSRVVRGLSQLQSDEGSILPARHVGRTAGEPPRTGDEFFQLSDAALLAGETREYVPRLIAATLIGRDPGRYGFRLRPESAARVDSVFVTKATRLDLIARTAGVSPGRVRELNPELVRGVTPPGTVTAVLLPRGISNEVREQIRALPAAQITPSMLRCAPESELGSVRSQRWRHVQWSPPSRRTVEVREGETLRDVARRCGVSVDTLSRLNHLPTDRVLRSGQAVRLP